jgi:hypothetical protein
MSELPKFAAEWAAQWKAAGPRLQAVRDAELRQLSHEPSVDPPMESVPRAYDLYPERNGLVIMQRWFQRKMILDRLAPGFAEPDADA